MQILKIEKNGEIICPYVEDASNFFRRFMGLMYRKSIPSDHGLLLTPCNEIHTFGMRFDIDTVTLSKDDEVLFIDRAVKPRKVRKKVKNGYKVLELNSGIADEIGIELGDKLVFSPFDKK
ncbi:MAG: DUF192 domain-containing protein [Eubacterium sp.]|nr:DUF192 domain-containing protein [Eubacterium sp.]